MTDNARSEGSDESETEQSNQLVDCRFNNNAYGVRVDGPIRLKVDGAEFADNGIDILANNVPGLEWKNTRFGATNTNQGEKRGSKLFGFGRRTPDKTCTECGFKALQYQETCRDGHTLPTS